MLKRRFASFFIGFSLLFPVNASAMMGDGNKGKKGDGKISSPMHSRAKRSAQEEAGLFQSGLVAVYPTDVTCLEVKSDFGDQTRYDGSFRSERSNHGYHNGFDISAEEGTPIIAIAAGEVLNLHTGGRLVGNQVMLRHSPEDTGLDIWVFSKYKHFQELPKFKVGDRVEMGQVLGPAGKTGTTGGHYGGHGYPHLHMSVYLNKTGDYRLSRKGVVIVEDVSFIDPLAVYLKNKPANLTNHTVRDLPEAEKQVPIAYKDLSGTINPPDTRFVWPFVCQ